MWASILSAPRKAIRSSFRRWFGKNQTPKTETTATTTTPTSPTSTPSTAASTNNTASKNMTVSKDPIYLLFSPRSTPYAEVATYLLANNGSTNGLQLGIGEKYYDPVSSLIIPKSVSNLPTKSHISGKIAISRYFARSSKTPIYESLSSASHIAHVDDWIDTIRTTNSKNPQSLKQLISQIEAKNGSYLVQSDTMTIADLLAWDTFKTVNVESMAPSKGFKNWFEKMESSSTCKEAVKWIDNVMRTMPIIDRFKVDLATQLSSVSGVAEETLLDAIEVPGNTTHGDLAVPLPKLRLKGNPAALAKEYAEKFKPTKYILGAKAIGPFLNFTINKPYLRDLVIPQILSMDNKYGSNSSGLGKTAVLDYSSPNIAKPFHAGHLRSTIIGNFIKKVLDASGWNTVGINYLGDWGKQYGLLAVGYKKYGDAKELKEDPIRHLFKVYVAINKDAEENPAVHDEAREYFTKMENGDKEALALWADFRSLSIEKYKDIYSRLNISFDIYSGESQFSNDLGWVLQHLRDLSLLQLSDGAQVVDLQRFDMAPALITKRDGSTLYLTRDIAAAVSRKNEYDFDAMYYVVGLQQDLHFRQLFKTLELMGYPWAKNCQHVAFGMIKSKSGEMSTRKGKVVFLEDILNHTQSEMHDVMKKNEAKYAQVENPEQVADVVGISSIIVQDMQARRIKDYEFDWNRMLSFEGDTGPYLQYAHARLCSVERTTGITISESDFPYDITEAQNLLAKLDEPAAMDLLLKIADYPDVIRKAARECEPVTIINYLFGLSHLISVAWEKIWVKGQEEDLAKVRMALYKVTRIVLGNALSMIGLKPLERM